MNTQLHEDLKGTIWEIANRLRGPLVVVESGASIGEGAIVGAQCFIGDGAVVSEGARLHARSTLGAACHLGRRSVLHGGAVIGSDGFGFAPTEGRWEKIEQLGGVSIGSISMRWARIWPTACSMNRPGSR